MSTAMDVVVVALLIVLVVAVIGFSHRLRRSGAASAQPPASGTAGTEEADRDRIVRREVVAELSAMRLQAIQAAAATKSEAETLATIARRVAEAEVEASRRALASEVDSARARIAADAENSRRTADIEASTVVLDARRQAERDAAELTAAARATQTDIERRERRVGEREDRLDADRERIEARQAGLDARAADIGEREQTLGDHAQRQRAELERVASLTAAEAKVELLSSLEVEVRHDAAILVRDIEAEARQNGDRRARKIVSDAVQRVASEQTAESVVSVIQLPSDEMKGRIIGREGRNIRAFESVTGVNLIIDDTPEAVLLSCFDPVRREVGRITLDTLVLDGRIHPHRIEEVYERSLAEIDERCARAAGDALLETRLSGVHPELSKLMGRLRYRTSYGQNVLAHLVECTHIADIIAAELQIDPVVLRRAAFLHDIGKALTHEVPGSHAILGGELARRYGESEDVAHAIEAHHNEVLPQTVEAVLVQAADACSGGRPGARREGLETYVQRLARIEEIASAHDGVDKVFAMQAGREVRVMVAPDHVDDLGAALLAREVAKQIESELTYPGQIRVTVVRESRATEIAR
ncbi:MAG: ribonuclease Y [Mycobacteriales bacterium]